MGGVAGTSPETSIAESESSTAESQSRSGDPYCAQVVTAIEKTYGPLLLEFHPTSFPEALEFIDALPFENENEVGLRPIRDGLDLRPIRAGIEMALLDLSMRVFERDMDAVVRWMGLPGFGAPGSRKRIRIASTLNTSQPPRLVQPLEETPEPQASACATRRNDFESNVVRFLRRSWWRGIRHFKLAICQLNDAKDAGAAWVDPTIADASLTAAFRYLKRAIAKGRASIRVDAGGGWSKDNAVEWLTDHADMWLAGIEQPLPRGSEDDLQILKDLFEIPLTHDESLVTLPDAHRLNELGVADVFHLNVSKCGGLLPALHIAAYARREAIRLQIGLSAGGGDMSFGATLALVDVCPGIEWFDLPAVTDAIAPPVSDCSYRIGFGKRLPRRTGGGYGIEVNPQRLKDQTIGDVIVLQL